MVAQILIQHGSTIYYPAVEEGITLELNRKGSPGKLKFNVIKDSVINFTEGDSVKLTVDGTTTQLLVAYAPWCQHLCPTVICDTHTESFTL